MNELKEVVNILVRAAGSIHKSDFHRRQLDARLQKKKGVCCNVEARTPF